MDRIPKVIHYCWFGGAELSDLTIKCIRSWKKYCPDYEIKQWDESNFDMNCCVYVQEAYSMKKWAFVSDYARFWILYNYGGVYLDTDVEIIKSIDDIVDAGAFMALEPYKVAGYKKRLSISSGLGIGASSGLDLYKSILEGYDKSHFTPPNEKKSTETVGLRVTKLFKSKGFIEKDEFQEIDGIKIYPTDYFCPLDYYTGIMRLTENTVCIHHYGMSWQSEFDKRMKKLERKYRLALGNRIGYFLFRVHRFTVKRLKRK